MGLPYTLLDLAYALIALFCMYSQWHIVHVVGHVVAMNFNLFLCEMNRVQHVEVQAHNLVSHVVQMAHCLVPLLYMFRIERRDAWRIVIITLSGFIKCDICGRV